MYQDLNKKIVLQTKSVKEQIPPIIDMIRSIPNPKTKTSSRTFALIFCLDSISNREMILYVISVHDRTTEIFGHCQRRVDHRQGVCSKGKLREKPNKESEQG